MNNKIGIKNFRVFKGMTEFEIRPLTILTGPNNSGKSSLTKLILAFQNNLNKIDFDDKGNHNLESFEKILNWDNPSNKELTVRASSPVLGFSSDFCYQITYVNDAVFDKNYISKIEILNTFENKVLVSLKSQKVIIDTEDELEMDLRLTQYSSKFYFDFEYMSELFSLSECNKKSTIISDLAEVNRNFLLTGTKENKKIITEKEKEGILKFQKEYFEAGGAGRRKEYNRGIETSFETFHELMKKLIINFKEFFIKEYPDFNVILETEFYTFLKDTFSVKNERIQDVRILEGDIHYISALRGSHKRVLFNNSESQINQIVVDYARVDAPDLEYLEEVLEIFEIEGKLIVERFENTISCIYLENLTNGRRTNIADLGFGYSQIIPIVLKIMTHVDDLKSEIMNMASLKGLLFIIEEPEANLHPNLQAKFADFIALTLKKFPKVNFIIETHSEYLLRKLQFLTAKGALNSNDTVIHYFNKDKYVSKQEPKVKHIFIDKYGGLSDSFGPGFFDESTRLQFDLLKLNKNQFN